jgi:nucleotide-binding universal stress UspA family protein
MIGNLFHRILVADDGSPEGERAASLGLRLAARLEAPPSCGVGSMGPPIEGWASTQIRKRTKADNVDLVIVGHSNLHKIRNWFLGTTSEAVARQTTCSVLVVR